MLNSTPFLWAIISPLLEPCVLVGSCIFKTSSSLATVINLEMSHSHLWAYNRTLARVDWFRDIHLTQCQTINASLWLLNLEIKTRIPFCLVEELGNIMYPRFCLAQRRPILRKEANMQKMKERWKWILIFLTLVSSATPALILLANTSPFFLKLVQVWFAKFHWIMTKMMHIRHIIY